MNWLGRVLYYFSMVVPLSIAPLWQVCKSEWWTMPAIMVAAMVAGAVLAWLWVLLAVRACAVDSLRAETAEIADMQYANVMLTYLIPCVCLFFNVSAENIRVLVFALALIVVLFQTRAPLVNPMLLLIGYHLYKVSTPRMGGYLYFTRRLIRDKVTIKSGVRAFSYFYIEVN